MTPFELRILPIHLLTPAEYNPRILSPRSPAYRKLKASIEEFGLLEPLIWNERTGRVVGGHARLRILKELGFHEVPVSVVRLDDLREKALNVVLNNQEAQGRYDPSKLAALLTELEGLPELELTGFDGKTLAALRMEPASLEPLGKQTSDQIEITIVTDPATYSRIAARLDAVVGEYDLICHVRHISA